MSFADGTEPITNDQDVIESHEVIARIEYLESVESDAEELDAELPEGVTRYALDDYERAELEALRKLAEQASGYAADWLYGETLIRDSHFEDYARALADDLGLLPNNAGWPTSYIDWEQAAGELQMDYTDVDFDGVTYWVR